MKRYVSAVVMMYVSGMFIASGAHAVESPDVDTRIGRLEQQIQAMQGELKTLKQDVVTERLGKEELASKVKALEAKPKSFIDRGMQGDEGFRLQSALGLDEESPVNIGGEIAMRYRENQKTDAGSNGFHFYELELFIDATVHENVSLYAEYDLLHSGSPEAEDVWIDLHTTDGPLAFAGGTGVKLGNFHYPFGWDNDDEEGYVYGGRTSVNNALIRSERIDGWRLRERQIGLAGYYNFDPTRELNISTAVGLFNGNGDVNHASGAVDNDRRKDLVGRVEAKYKDAVIGASYLFAPRTRNAAANTNNLAHIRDITRYGIHWKYPDVTFPGQDVSLGGMPWMVWGEYVWGTNEGNTYVAAANDTQKLHGGYVELDAMLVPDWNLLGFTRLDYYDPNTDISKDYAYAITPGVRFAVWNSTSVVVEYEHYGGGKSASTGITDDDRVAVQVTTQF